MRDRYLLALQFQVALLFRFWLIDNSFRQSGIGFMHLLNLLVLFQRVDELK